MMNFAEKLVKEKGFSKVGLAVEKDNKFLIGLYTKRGYKDWGKGGVIETWKELRNGRMKRVSESCVYLIKKLK